MELMIKYSEFLTIIIQAFFITVAGFIFVGCWDELIADIKMSRKTLKKRGGSVNLRNYSCPKCGFRAWALDHIIDTKCHSCGNSVTTEPVPKIEKSFVCNDKKLKSGQRFATK